MSINASPQRLAKNIKKINVKLQQYEYDYEADQEYKNNKKLQRLFGNTSKSYRHRKSNRFPAP